jgi:hypothetical protein
MLNSIVFREDADPVAFLNAIGDLDGGSEALADYFSEKWSRIEAFARSGSFDTEDDDGEILSETALLANAYVKPRVEEDEVADQDWMQLAWLLRHDCPDLFVEMLLVLRAKARAHEAGQGEEAQTEEDHSKVETSDTDRGKATPAALEADEESAI